MDEKLRHLLDQMPERAPRSKLEPHAEVIRELRKKRRTYQEIAAFFREHLQLSVAPSTIHDFVKTRARRQARERALTMPELPAHPEPDTRTVPASMTVSASSSQNEARERMRALKAQPPPAKQEPARFQFDPQEPLTLKSEQKEK